MPRNFFSAKTHYQSACRMSNRVEAPDRPGRSLGLAGLGKVRRPLAALEALQVRSATIDGEAVVCDGQHPCPRRPRVEGLSAPLGRPPRALGLEGVREGFL